VNDGSAINILSMEIMVQMRILFLKLTLVKTLFIGIEDSGVSMNGALESSVMMGTLLRRVSLQ
jgi:4-hydroxy-3-methylbut-2-en-1-yl diphosphate synthase IspG/GcpE